MQISGEGKFSILIGLVGIAGAGIIVLAPDRPWIGWGLIAISAICLMVLIYHHFNEKLGRPRALAILLMILGGIAFFGGAIWYGIEAEKRTPNGTAQPKASLSSPKPWKHELEDLYNTDFNLLSMQREFDATTIETPDDTTPIIIKIRFRIYQDFNSATDFVSIFIPISHNTKTDERIYGVIGSLRDQIKPLYDDLKKSVGTGMGGPGLPYSEGKDLKFSGRVFIYTMQPFTPIQIGDLMKWYQGAGLSLQIRGSDYWSANKDR